MQMLDLGGHNRSTTNTLAYSGSKLITIVKSVIVQSLGIGVNLILIDGSVI
jgi:hypothetical protein